jgi:FkbM family methyltransferase
VADHRHHDIGPDPGAHSCGGVTARIADHTFLPSLIGSNSIVLDLGANRGQFTRAVVRDFGCKVHAVEPNPGLFTSLERLAIPGVTVHGVALSGTSGSRPFMVTDNSEASHFTDANDSGEGAVQVQTLTLQDLLSRLPGTTSIDLVKMDIEGAELDVLEGAPAELLRRIGQLTVEFHQFVYPESRRRIEGIKKRFRELGFWIVDFSRSNYDVLFVNASLKTGLRTRASAVVEKHQQRIRRKLSSLLVH